MITSMSFGMFKNEGKDTKCHVFYSTPVTEKGLRKIWLDWNAQLQAHANALIGMKFPEGDSHTTSVKVEMMTHDPKVVVNDMCSRFLVFPSTDKIDEMILAILYHVAVKNGGKESSDFEKVHNLLLEKMKRLLEEIDDEIAQAGNEEPLEPNDEAGKEV